MDVARSEWAGRDRSYDGLAELEGSFAERKALGHDEVEAIAVPRRRIDVGDAPDRRRGLRVLVGSHRIDDRVVEHRAHARRARSRSGVRRKAPPHAPLVVRREVVTKRFFLASVAIAAAGGSRTSTSSCSANKTSCTPACQADQYCVLPGACNGDPRCVARADVDCPEAGLRSLTGCAGALDASAGTVTCVCR